MHPATTLGDDVTDGILRDTGQVLGTIRVRLHLPGVPQLLVEEHGGGDGHHLALVLYLAGGDSAVDDEFDGTDRLVQPSGCHDRNDLALELTSHERRHIASGDGAQTRVVPDEQPAGIRVDGSKVRNVHVPAVAYGLGHLAVEVFEHPVAGFGSVIGVVPDHESVLLRSPLTNQRLQPIEVENLDCVDHLSRLLWVAGIEPAENVTTGGGLAFVPKQPRR